MAIERGDGVTEADGVVLVAACRFTCALVLATAAIPKIRARAAFASTLKALKLPTEAVGLVAIVFPIAELGLALLLAFGAGLTVSAGAAAVLFGAVTVVVGINVMRGRGVRCNCFGESGDVLGPAAVARNALLTGSALIVASAAYDLSALPPTIGVEALLAMSGLVSLGFVFFRLIGSLDTLRGELVLLRSTRAHSARFTSYRAGEASAQ